MMIGQRVKAKNGLYTHNKLAKRLGTITGENHKGTSWWVRWDGNVGIVQIKKNMLEIVSNVGDIVNDVLFFKLKQ